MSATPAVRLDGVVRRYADRDAPAVDDVSLQIERGEVVSLLGPNGAGKTTTIEMITGLLRPTSGTVRTLGLDPVVDRDEIRRRVAVQPQHAAVFDQQTVQELLRTWASFYPDARRPEEVVERLGLTDSRDVRVARLSGGQRQRVLVGLALVSRPELLVLDEPSTGLDPNARLELWDAVREARDGGTTVLLSTHAMEEAEELSDRVALVCRGRLAAYDDATALVARYAPGCEVRATLPAGTSLGALDELRASGAQVVGAEGGRRAGDVLVRTDDADAALRVLTAVGAHHLHLRESGLAGVFRALTGADLDEPAGEPGSAPAPPRRDLATAARGDR